MARLRIKKLLVDLDFTPPKYAQGGQQQGIRKSIGQIKKIIPFARPFYKHFILLGLFSIISAVLGMVMPFAPKLIIDDGVAKNDFKLIVVVVIVTSMVSVLEYLLNWFIGLYNNYLSKYISFKTNNLFLKKLNRLDDEIISSQRSGDIIDRMSGLQDGIMLVSDLINKICTMVVRLTIIPAAIAIMDWRIAVFGVPIMALVTIGWYYLQNYLRSYNMNQMMLSGLLNSSLYDMVSSMQDVRMAGQFNRVFVSYIKEYVNVWRKEIVIYLISTSFYLIQNILVIIMTLALSIFGWYQVVAGIWTLGKMATIMIALGYVVSPFQSLFEMGSSIVNTSVSVERFFEIFDAKELEKKKGVSFPKSVKNIQLQKIVFGYKNSDLLLHNLDLSVEKGKIFVITGDSGTGKSTILKILSGLLKPHTGNVFIDGMELSKIDSSSWFSNVALLSQTPFFLRSTFKENILFGNNNLSEYDNLIRIFRLEHVEKRLANSILDENANNLSSGEKQRVSLCRMLLRNKPILLLDEPLSQVDMPTVNSIFSEILTKLKKSICIIVTHNPIIINYADKVGFLYQGKLYDDKARGSPSV